MHPAGEPQCQSKLHFEIGNSFHLKGTGILPEITQKDLKSL